MNPELNYRMAQVRQAEYARQAEEWRRALSATTRGVVTSDGRRLSVRQLGPSDKRGLVRLFDRLSPESRHRRFLSPKPRLAPRELTFLTEVDGYRHDAIAAVDDRDGSIVGTSRYVRHADRQHVADFAIEVVDEFQRRCVGTALAGLTIQRARANGVAALTARTLWDNHGARALLRRYGFRAVGRDGGEIDYELPLEPLTSAPHGLAN
jgi:RimJ/RimL family protein N-acetyltransferase